MVGIDDAQDRALEIGAAADRVQVLAGQRIPGDRVDREVAPTRGLVERHPRIAFDDESLVAAAALRLAARQGDVDAAQLEHGKGLADRLDPPELRQDGQPSCGTPNTSMSRSFDSAEQAIADEAADDQGAPAIDPDVCGDAARRHPGIREPRTQKLTRSGLARGFRR